MLNTVDHNHLFSGEEASDIENAVLESSLSVDPHFYHAYFARPKPKICDETELQKVQDENIFQRLGAGFKPPLRMPDSCHPQIPKTQVLPNSNRLAAINTPIEGCSLSDNESANCDRSLDLEDGIENMIKMASSQTTGSPKKSKNSKPKFDVYKHIRADGDSLIESNQNVHHCGICGNYAALTKETLEKHWRTHYKERPHKVSKHHWHFSYCLLAMIFSSKFLTWWDSFVCNFSLDELFYSKEDKSLLVKFLARISFEVQVNIYFQHQ